MNKSTVIQDAFSRGKAFIAFITCGDPDLDTTVEAVKAAANGGADIIELGIPFSDPTAEGPVIQAANFRALSGGVTTDKIFATVETIRKTVSVPLVFMTYANVVFSCGTERFLARAKAVGIDGLILPDVPYEEKNEFAPACKDAGLDFISLVAPTSADRIATIARDAEGFLYVVSSLGVTGVRDAITTDIKALVNTAKQYASVPCAVGFGISTPEQAYAMSRAADGVIVGSAIVKLLAEHGKAAPPKIEDYVRRMKAAIVK